MEGAKNFIEINKNRYKKPIKTDNKKVKEINIIKVKGRKEQAELITEILAKSKAVSYTHLDVYKRQKVHISHEPGVFAFFGYLRPHGVQSSS